MGLKEGNKNVDGSALLAINDYDQALETQESAEAFCKRAWAYFYIKDYEQAQSDIERAQSLNPRCTEALCCAASVHIALNEHHEALDILKEALELTSPIDFRRSAIEEVMNGTKLALKLEQTQPDKPLQTVSQNSSESENESEPVMVAEVSSESVLEGEVVVDGATTSMEKMAAPSPEKMVDLPFDDPSFMDLQKDLTEQMVTMGGDEFQKKLMKLNEIPAVQQFQRKALKGEKPDYNDYMALMKDRKFKQYNDVMTQIAKNPKFESVTAKFAAMDWMGAYKELQKDPDALALYMKAFEALDDD